MIRISMNLRRMTNIRILLLDQVNTIINNFNHQLKNKIKKRDINFSEALKIDLRVQSLLKEMILINIHQPM